MPLTDLISTALLISALVAVTSFITLYAKGSPWRITQVGRSVMALAVSVVLLILVAMFRNIFGPDYPFRDAFRISSYLVLNGALWYQFYILRRMQNADFRATERARLELDILPTGPDSGEMRKVNDTTSKI